MSTFDIAATDFYDRLGLERGASEREVRAAYARAVRLYPPERHEEEFKRIREAYETLSDSESRAEYDATADPAVQAFVQRGQEALQADDHEGAIAAFKRALVLEPEAHFVRNLLGVTYLYADAQTDALKQFERLTRELPGNHLYWTHRAAAEHRLERYEAAEAHYGRAIDLEPEETSAHEGLAQVLADQDRFPEAERVLTRAIHADGTVDFDDISLLFKLMVLRLQRGDLDAMRVVADRIEAVLTEEWQRNRVAYRFATLAGSLVELQAFELALVLAERSEVLAPDDTAIAALTQYIRKNNEIIAEWKGLQDNDRVRGGVKYLIAVVLQKLFHEFDTEEEEQQAVQNAVEILSTEATTVVAGGEGRRSLEDELAYIEAVYPAIAGALSEDLKHSIRASAGHATLALLACPHCGHSGRAKDETGRYTCPGCGRSFDYDSKRGRTSKRSGAVQIRKLGRSLLGALWGIGVWFGLALLIAVGQSC